MAGRNYKFFNDPVITACYWGNNGQTQGIGENQAGTDVEATLVTGGWTEDIIIAMNAALAGNNYKWTLGIDGLPTLTQ